MRFLYPYYIYYGLFCAAVLLIFLIWSERRYRRVAMTFAKERSLNLIAPFYSSRHPGLRMALLLIAIIMLSVAVARPQWGFYLIGERDKGRDIIFALDVSRSMTSQDISPDRFTHAKDEIANYIGSNDYDRTALIGFSGDAFLYCPLTMNKDVFLRILEGLDVGSVKRGGTSFHNLMVEASRSFSGAATKDKMLVILSDGEDTEGSLEKAIDSAKKDRIEVYSIGVGTASGGLMPSDDKRSGGAFVKDDKGLPVRTRLDESALKRLAAQTGGSYERASSGEHALDKIKEKWSSRSKEVVAGVVKEEAFDRVYKERFQIPLLLTFIALIAELFLSIVNQGAKT